MDNQPLIKALGLLLLATFVPGCKHEAFQVELTNCQSQVRSIGSVIMLYREDHQERLPAKLSHLASESGMSDGVSRALICPGTKHQRGSASNADEWSDYVYIDWSQSFPSTNIPPTFPILFDRDTLNHHGRGINILLANMTVFWDEDCTWLKTFARTNKDARLVVPK